MTIIGQIAEPLEPESRLRGENTLFRRCSNVLSYRPRALFILPAVMLLPINCSPTTTVPAATPVAAAPEPLTVPEQGWQSRRRDWDRLLIGLDSLPERPLLTAKPVGPGKLFEIPSGRLLGQVRPGAPLMLSPGPGETVRFAAKGVSGTAAILRLVTGAESFRLEGRRHTGTLLCWWNGERVVCAVDAPLEGYLLGVLPGEVPSSWPMEAQKALAVAARAYSQASRGKHAAEGFDLCDRTHCQMYLGRVAGAARSELAVRQTKGLHALSNGQPIRAFYSADCGGRTANNEDVHFSDNPTEPQPYLRSVPDVPWPGGPHFCARSSHHRWTRRLPAERIEAALNDDPETAVGTLRTLHVSDVDSTGRARTVRLAGLMHAPPGSRGQGTGDETAVDSKEVKRDEAIAPTGSPPPTLFEEPPPPAMALQSTIRDLAGYTFRLAVGPRTLKSTRFTIIPLGSRRIGLAGAPPPAGAIAPSAYKVTGAGYGHGVGLCQIGARGMASPPYNRTFRQILSHYYRGIRIAPFHPETPPP
jgi:stage II sporulation protein D